MLVSHWGKELLIEMLCKNICITNNSDKGYHLLREEKVGEHFLPRDGIRVGVKLHQRLRLVLRQPDGRD